MKGKIFPVSMVAVAVAALCSGQVQAAGNEVDIDASKLTAPGSQDVKSYIVQLAGATGIEKAAELGQLSANNPQVTQALNQYNSQDPQVVVYNEGLRKLQEQLATQYSTSGLIYSYTHTFNGFAARMTEAQAANLRLQPGVVGVWEDQPEQVTTNKTPRLLGLTGAGGQHTLGIKGENIIVGVIDTGISPNNPAFADDGSYPVLSRYKGTCDKGQDAAFSCNNKLIGARYFKAAFESTYAIQPGEFISPRDADSHGSHTASTSAGNEGVTATIGGVNWGKISGIAPRARVAMYKACWNSDYTSPAGVQERGCFYGDTMAAIDQAVADGVDVINYSIGGSLTDLTTVAAAAKLRATQAGVVVAVSAGNSGANNAMETVGTPAPWVISVAASGFAVNALGVNSGLATPRITAVEGSVTKALDLTGDVSGKLVIGAPFHGCADLTNAADIKDNIVLLQRGSCPFADKVTQAQKAGAKAIVVANNAAGNPIAMGGTLASPATIPGLMVTQDGANALVAAINAGTVVNVTLSPSYVSNAMADFSSKGPNKATYDILKPDITAPGVNILAAATPTTFTKPQGNDFTLMSGTSMSSPHIAGMAALLKEQHPNWSPAMIKSALMTTAHQQVTKASSVVAADPFDFGAGHAAPVAAMDPGLVYDATANDYFAFLCGLGNSSFVQAASGYSCAAYTNAGYPTDASQLNYPSVAISKLKEAKTIVRVVTDVTGNGGTYVPTIEAPAGVTVEFKALNANGVLAAASSLQVPANGKAVYGLTFTPTANAVMDQWKFGALTLSDGVHSVRSPLVVKAVLPDLLKAPASQSALVDKTAGKLTFLADAFYNGATSGKLYGLQSAVGSSKTVKQDADKTFSFNEAGMGLTTLLVPEGTKVLRLSLRNSLTSNAALKPNIDLYVYRCIKLSCSPVAVAQNAEANEDIVLTNPLAANNGANGDYYIVWAHGRDLKGAAQLNYTLAYWVVTAPNATNSALVYSTRAIAGRPNLVTVSTKNLAVGSLPYMGMVELFDNVNRKQTSTVLEVFAK